MSNSSAINGQPGPITGRVPPAVSRFVEALLSRAGVSDYDGSQLLREAFQLVPRDKFLEERYRARALEDSRLPTGFGQLSESPYLLARMLAVLGIAPGHAVLELECGSGYGSALMCVLGARVFATDKLGLRAQATRRHLDAMGFNRVLIATGHLAWNDQAPFDSILSHQALIDTRKESAVTNIGMNDLNAMIALLKPDGGKLVAPLAGAETSQLLFVERYDGQVHTRVL